MSGVQCKSLPDWLHLNSGGQLLPHQPLFKAKASQVAQECHLLTYSPATDDFSGSRSCFWFRSAHVICTCTCYLTGLHMLFGVKAMTIGSKHMRIHSPSSTCSRFFFPEAASAFSLCFYYRPDLFSLSKSNEPVESKFKMLFTEPASTFRRRARPK